MNSVCVEKYENLSNIIWDFSVFWILPIDKQAVYFFLTLPYPAIPKVET